MAAPNLEMYRSDTLAEVGTLANPIDFGFCDAGDETSLSYDVLLYNDKGDVLDSDDAKSIEIELLRLYTTNQWTSNGNPSQSYTVSYIPVLSDIEEEVTVDGTEWRRVTTFSGLGPTDEVYKFDYTTGELEFGNGAEGKIPPNGDTIAITYTPDLNTFGKTIYSDQWISVKSSGVMTNEIHITTEESTKIDNNTVEVLHFPIVTTVVGVWDNVSKTGTNYYTGGSFDGSTGRITLGTPLTAATPYTEYKYQIKDDNEATYTPLGAGETHSFDNRIPKNNAKRLQFKADVPSSAGTEGGAYLKAALRIYYSF